MATFVFAYRMPKNYIPGKAEALAAWRAFFEGMGDNLVDMGKPVFERSTLGNCPADTALGGYSIVSADDLEAAVALAKGCPALDGDGGVEVGVLADLAV